MKNFFSACRKLMSAFVNVCVDRVFREANASDVYRDGWERPDPDEAR